MTGNEITIIEDASRIVRPVWARTDFDSIDSGRNIDDEFSSRIATSAYTDSVHSFFSRLCDRWGVRSVADQGSLRLIEEYDSEDGTDAKKFLRVVRNNSELIVLEMKNIGDQQ